MRKFVIRNYKQKHLDLFKGYSDIGRIKANHFPSKYPHLEVGSKTIVATTWNTEVVDVHSISQMILKGCIS